MDSKQYTTFSTERKKGQHLRLEDRVIIQVLNKLGYSNNAVAKMLNCSPSTVGNELKRGTPERKSDRGRVPGYSAKRGEAVYKANRSHSKKPHKIQRCAAFLEWMTKQVREHKWSLDACVGYAKLHRMFSPDEMVSTGTLYNEAWAGNLELSILELPNAIGRKPRKGHKHRENRRNYGKSISERPEIAAQRIEAGHWEIDTVVGKRAGKGPVILSLLEKMTQFYLAIRIPGKDSASVLQAMQKLKDEFGDRFSTVFKTITADNGSEFADLSQIEQWGCNVYFAHPYTSWERPQDERHNGLFRAYVPKGVSIEDFSEEYITLSAYELSGRPRKKLGYHTPEELFDAFLDSVYSVDKSDRQP